MVARPSVHYTTGGPYIEEVGRYMFISLRRKDPALCLAILAGAPISGCSKDAGQVRSMESGRSVDTSTQARTDAAVAVTPAAGQQSARESTPPPKASSLPRPSMDPGRMPRAKPADSARAAKSPADSTAKTPAASAPAGQDQRLKYDAAVNTVTFELIAGPFNFNGYASGGGTLKLPPKANVVINFVNKDGTPHSAEVISGDGPTPNAAIDPAIPRAYTNKVLEGLPQEAGDVMRFTVPDSGTYRIFCGVPGHGLSGMWIWMRVDPAAKAPSFGSTKA